MQNPRNTHASVGDESILKSLGEWRFRVERGEATAASGSRFHDTGSDADGMGTHPNRSSRRVTNERRAVLQLALIQPGRNHPVTKPSPDDWRTEGSERARPQRGDLET
jgi:hypothetical protein